MFNLEKTKEKKPHIGNLVQINKVKLKYVKKTLSVQSNNYELKILCVIVKAKRELLRIIYALVAVYSYIRSGEIKY